MVLHGIWALSIKCSFMAHSACQFGLVDPSGLRDLFRSVRTAIGIAENRPLFLVLIDFASIIDSNLLPTRLPWISPPGVSWKGHVQENHKIQQRTYPDLFMSRCLRQLGLINASKGTGLRTSNRSRHGHWRPSPAGHSSRR